MVSVGQGRESNVLQSFIFKIFNIMFKHNTFLMLELCGIDFQRHLEFVLNPGETSFEIVP